MPPPRWRFGVGDDAQAADATKIALVPGGPHPYFAAWEKAGQDAMKGFQPWRSRLPGSTKWELSVQNSLLESLLSQGYNAFLVFPGRSRRSNSTVQELTENGAPVIATAGCLKEPTTASFLLWHRHRQFGVSRHERADQGDGRQGPHRPFHRFPRRSEYAVAH